MGWWVGLIQGEDNSWLLSENKATFEMYNQLPEPDKKFIKRIITTCKVQWDKNGKI
jgi:hypothetical protein